MGFGPLRHTIAAPPPTSNYYPSSMGAVQCAISLTLQGILANVHNSCTKVDSDLLSLRGISTIFLFRKLYNSEDCR